MLIDADHADTVEPARVIYQSLAPLREDRSVRGAPGNPETSGDSGDGEVVKNDALERPRQAGAGDLGTRACRRSGVLPPCRPTVIATVPTHSHHQNSGPMPERFMRETPNDCVSRLSFRTTLSAPRICLRDTAFDRRPIQLKPLAHGYEPQLI
ncbi:hypothetical protein HNR16_002344 [Pseudoclavibacter chungangensis]|nr:hypothetical protein [Pseudoclavibacter chungangensis]